MAKLRVDKIASVGVSTETTGSVFFDGTGDYIKSSIDSEDFAFSGDFAMECWVQKVGNGSHADGVGNVIMMTGNASNNRNGIWISVTNTGSLLGKVAYDTSSWALEISGGTLSNDVWYHVALTRSGSTVRLFLDGVQQASGSNSTDITTTFSNAFSAGGQFNPAGSRHINGYVSNARILKGRALYTSNFAPPTTELEVVDDTVLLCCHDGENIFADKSGRHVIAAYGDRSSTPTPTSTASPVGVTTNNPGITRDVDNTFGPTFQGGAAYASQNWLTLSKGTTTERFPDFGAVDAASARGLFGGGFLASPILGSNHIDYITISTLSNSQDFGDLFTGTYNIAALSSRTRGVWAGGQESPGVIPNVMQYVTISSTGNADDFGDLNLIRQNSTGASNSTRGLWLGGHNPSASPSTVLNAIEMITIQSTGNTQDFGDLTEAVQAQRSCASPTRALKFGGSTSGASGGRVQTIDYVTISTTGNAVQFGDLEAAAWFHGACSNSTRGINFGNNPATNVIDFVTIATLGNAQDFGFLSETFTNCSAVSSSTRAVMADGGQATMEYVTIATTGNSQDFGNFVGDGVHNIAAGCGNGHGGLG